MEKKNIINSSIMCFQLLYFNCIFSQLLPPPKALWAENWSSNGFTAKWIGPKGLYKLEVSNDTFFNLLLSGYPKYIKGDSYNVLVPSCGIYYYRVAYASPCDSTQISHYSNTIEVLAANLPQIGPNQWAQLTGIHHPPLSMPERQNQVVARVGKKIYVGMGDNGSSCFYDWWEWDPCSGWTQKASLPANPGAGGGLPFVFVINDSIYVGGGDYVCGSYYSNVYKYNVVTNQWTQVASLPSGRWGAPGTSDGKYGYVLGGYNGTTYLSDLLRYDPVNNTWIQISSYPADGRRIPFISYYNGKIYCGTGHNSSGCYSEAYSYDVLTNSWVPIANYPVTQYDSWAVSVNGKVFVTGGHPMCGSSCTNQFYYYDINLGIWQAMAAFPGGNRNNLEGAAIANFIFMGFGHNCGNLIKDWWMYRIP